jgi:S-adenosylmethionine:tRNA ribosyltransferase-isomerase
VETARFSYHLPRELIARYPLPRGKARLLVVDRAGRRILHRRVEDLRTFLGPGDVMVLNDTKVIPARLMGRKETGGGAEVLLLKELEPARWRCLIKASKKLRQGARIFFKEGLSGCIDERVGDEYIVSFSDQGCILTQGTMPLPPYLEREAEASDWETYQTVYALHDGSVAAPTAGLHFTPEILENLASEGVVVVFLTLHVGPGTFKPVRARKVEEHVMHKEEYSVSAQAARTIQGAMNEGRRIVAVGTTTTRVLEHLMHTRGNIVQGKGSTDIFIYNGFSFQAVDVLLTNFHLPCSTLLMLVSAFTGHDLLMEAYEEAILNRYRFFSYGDAMLII